MAQSAKYGSLGWLVQTSAFAQSAVVSAQSAQCSVSPNAQSSMFFIVLGQPECFRMLHFFSFFCFFF
jgi:hypothetical protein